MPLERHTTFYELWDALAAPDACAICRLRRKRARAFMEGFFYENVNEPGLRENLHDSLGFSPEALSLAEDIHDALGLSIVYAALCDDVARRLVRPEPSLSPEQPCPLAAHARETEQRYLAEFARHYADEDLQARYETGFGFCVGHLREVLALLGDRTLRQRLCAAETRKFTALRDELKRFEAKNDYRNREPFGGEADGWQRALRKFRRPEQFGAPV